MVQRTETGSPRGTPWKRCPQGRFENFESEVVDVMSGSQGRCEVQEGGSREMKSIRF